MFKFIIIFSLLFSILNTDTSYADIEEDSNYALILAYKNIGEDNNISLKNFENQIKLLSKNNYNIISITEIIEKLKNKKQLPNKTIGLSIDGENAYIKDIIAPILIKNNLPFTIFINSENLSTSNYYMDWPDIKKLNKKSLIDIGLSLSKNFNKDLYNVRENLKYNTKLISYPNGEYGLKTDNVVKKYNNLKAFTYDVGLVNKNSNFLKIPRFKIEQEYADIERFKVILNSKPLPVYDVLPIDNYIKDNKPVIGFTVTEEIKDLSKLKCFASNQGKLDLKSLGNNRIEIRTKLEISNYRTNINCTSPIKREKAGENLYTRWFGMTLTHKNTDNNLFE